MRKLIRHSIAWSSLETKLSEKRTELFLLPLPRVYKKDNDVWKIVDKYSNDPLKILLKEELKKIWKSSINHDDLLCCYCEKKITTDNWHIEHIKPKNTYPDNSFDWNNFLPSCDQCNSNYKKTQYIAWFLDPSKIWYDFLSNFDYFENNFLYKPLNQNAIDTVWIVWINKTNSHSVKGREAILNQVRNSINTKKRKTPSISKQNLYNDIKDELYNYVISYETFINWLLDHPNSPLYNELH